MYPTVVTFSSTQFTEMMRIATTLLLGCLSNTVATQLNVLVPPKGWNSWDCFQGDLNGTCAHLLVIEVIDPTLLHSFLFFFLPFPSLLTAVHPLRATVGDALGLLQKLARQPLRKPWSSTFFLPVSIFISLATLLLLPSPPNVSVDYMIYCCRL